MVYYSWKQSVYSRSDKLPEWLDQELLSKPHETKHGYHIAHAEQVDPGCARNEHYRQGYPEHVHEHEVLQYIQVGTANKYKVYMPVHCTYIQFINFWRANWGDIDQYS